MIGLGEGSRLVSVFEQVCAVEKKLVDKGDLTRVPSALKTPANALVPTRLIVSTLQPPACTSRWVRRDISATPNSGLHRWVKDSLPPPTLSSQPFHVPEYNDQQYEELIGCLDLRWTRQETDDLVEVIRACEGNFIAAHDRHCSKYPQRQVEDIQARYVALLAALTPGAAITPFSREEAVARRLNAEKLFKRTRVQSAHEAALVSSLHKCEVQLRQREKAGLAFQRIIAMPASERDAAVNDSVLTADEYLSQRSGEVLAVNTGATMCANWPQLSPLQNKKVELALRRLDVYSPVHANPDTARLFEELRGRLLMLFSLSQRTEQRQAELAAVRVELRMDEKTESGDKNKKVKDG